MSNDQQVEAVEIGFLQLDLGDHQQKFAVLTAKEDVDSVQEQLAEDVDRLAALVESAEVWLEVR